jgi:hypothetical protein
VRRWYAARDLPAMVAVSYPLDCPGDSTTDRFLSQRGWSIRLSPLTAVDVILLPF